MISGSTALSAARTLRESTRAIAGRSQSRARIDTCPSWMSMPPIDDDENQRRRGQDENRINSAFHTAQRLMRLVPLFVLSHGRRNLRVVQCGKPRRSRLYGRRGTAASPPHTSINAY